MAYEYRTDEQRDSKWSLPDVEVFQLTALEVAEMDEDRIHEYTQRREFRLAGMNGQIREKMLDAMIEAEGITGGWYWWTCLPGCMPDSSPFGPFTTYEEALENAREME